MKKYSIFKYVVCVMTLMAVLVSCSDSSESILLGSDDQLHFSSAEDGRNFTVCPTGAWQITTDAQWLSFSKSNGEGDGQTREQIVITAARNTGTARQASFQLTAAGKTLTVTCEQEEGRPFTWGAPSLSSSLQVGHPATGLTVNIPYEYGYKGMKFTLHASFSGEASEGLSMEDEIVTLDAATGILSLPLGGTPVKSGQLTITIQADQADVAAVSLDAKVSDWIILEQHFDLCIYGGDFVAGHPGTMPKWAKDDEGKNILPDPLGELQKRTANQDGSNDLFATMAHSYLVSKGLEGWEGSKVYERPGYIKLGTASAVSRPRSAWHGQERRRGFAQSGRVVRGRGWKPCHQSGRFRHSFRHEVCLQAHENQGRQRMGGREVHDSRRFCRHAPRLHDQGQQAVCH